LPDKAAVAGKMSWIFLVGGGLKDDFRHFLPERNQKNGRIFSSPKARLRLLNTFKSGGKAVVGEIRLFSKGRPLPNGNLQVQAFKFDFNYKFVSIPHLRHLT
jgi:hypothetical protein